MRRLRALDERADDVGLAPVVEVAAEAGVRLGAPLLGHPRRHDRLAVRGRRGDLRDGEVAVDGEGERPRDRGRRHVEDVRRPTLAEGGALLDAEAVLLVDDRHGEVGELDLTLDERVRPDGDPDVAGGDELVDGAALARRQARREQRDADAELRAELLDREEVLLGERLGRGHQRALPARLHGPEQRVQRDGRLARADVALEEPLHGRRAAEVGVDLGDRVLLRLGERERQRLAVPGRELAGERQRLRHERLALDRPPAERELQRQQLVERQAAPRALGVVLPARAVDAHERVGPEGQPLLDADGCRQRLAACTRVRERALGHGPQRLLRQVGGRRIDGREVRRLHAVADVVRWRPGSRSGSASRGGGAACRASASPRATAG